MDVLHETEKAILTGHAWRNDGKWILAERLHPIIQARQASEVLPAIEELTVAIQKGNTAIGFLAYEAAAAFGLPVHSSLYPEFPYLWFGIIAEHDLHFVAKNEYEFTPCRLPPIQFSLSQDAYQQTIETIRQKIAAGETYQVNFTQRADFEFGESPEDFFHCMELSQPVPYSAFLNAGTWSVLSLSPELFLRKRGNLLESRPMKGTAKRGRFPSEDRKLAEELKHNEKNQSENLMILDMMRNDFGKICRFGSVIASDLFKIERYRTLFQMTSTVRGQLIADTPLSAIFAATFPAASITGAPKHRTMQIIRDLEKSPRGVYCGALGILYPNGDFDFNVAIRTLYRQQNQYRLGIGGGILWDSTSTEEYEENLTKIQFIHSTPVQFALLETLLLDEHGHYRFFVDHLDRLEMSADYWNFPIDRSKIICLLQQYARRQAGPCAVRLQLSENGEMVITHRSVTIPPPTVRVIVSDKPIDSANPFLFHKTTNRKMYDRERRTALDNDFFEVFFVNEKGHVTEGSITNFFYRLRHEWFTPPIEDGLLNGIWRQQFIKEVRARERSIEKQELMTSDELVIGNSVMGKAQIHQLTTESHR
ncbi:MAG: aminodeoxychorismate synthase component I [Candidatus Omnitrophota bacterium]|jgi:para-aminobenzoate synthetase/4-amino-4-deoxychorismate lyase|nr:MAG: aminodeoxychorismate synthase component I [Candidatus Omnitrophota bacterium]